MRHRNAATYLSALIFLAACGGDDGAETMSGGDDPMNGGDGDGAGQASPPPPNAGPEMLDPSVDWESITLTYSPMYSAYDGEHVFSLPCYVDGTATALEDWSAIPSDAVSFSEWQSDDGSQVGVLITIERAEPEVTIAVRQGSIGGTAQLFVTEGTPAQWDVGRERYLNGDTFDIEAITSDPTLFMRLPELITFNPDGTFGFTGTAADLGISSNMRCDTCHTTTADTFQVEHTPTQAALYSDEQLSTIFREGMKPEGIGFRALPEMLQTLYPVAHKWEATTEQIEGLIIYLRSLTPKGQGEVLLPAGLGGDIPYDQLPVACNPDGPMYDPVSCLAQLPPECNPTGLEFDQELCNMALGIM